MGSDRLLAGQNRQSFRVIIVGSEYNVQICNLSKYKDVYCKARHGARLSAHHARSNLFRPPFLPSRSTSSFSQSGSLSGTYISNFEPPFTLTGSLSIQGLGTEKSCSTFLVGLFGLCFTDVVVSSLVSRSPFIFFSVLYSISSSPQISRQPAVPLLHSSNGHARSSSVLLLTGSYSLPFHNSHP